MKPMHVFNHAARKGLLVLLAAGACSACGAEHQNPDREPNIELADLELPPMETPDPGWLTEPLRTEASREPAPSPSPSPAPARIERTREEASTAPGTSPLARFVETLQRQLAKHGFDPGPVDGIYGERTAAAVRALQASNDHEATGELDRATLAALLAPEPPEEEIVPVRGEDEARTVEPAARPTHDVTTILGMLGAGVAFGILSAAALMRRDAAGAARETSRRSR